jgi:hypothetical protein
MQKAEVCDKWQQIQNQEELNRAVAETSCLPQDLVCLSFAMFPDQPLYRIKRDFSKTVL